MLCVLGGPFARMQAVQPHMGKCFDGIRRLDFGDDPKSIDIFAMISGEGPKP